jgi:hypothetical protein
MVDQKNPDDSTRDLPISLLGIEPILRFLNQSKELTSIRSISEHTGISMRVVKNILLQLEKFDQVERIVEENKVLPKWQITKFGKKVIKKANGIDDEIKFLSTEDELIHDILIPSNGEELQKSLEITHDHIITELNKTQTELSKILGPILNLNNPIFEDLMSLTIKRVKYLKVFTSTLSKDPVDSYLNIKKFDEKKRKLSKNEIQEIHAEVLFLNSIIINQLNRILDYINRISYLLEKEAYSNAFTLAKDLREELRVASNFLNQRESVKVNQHVFNADQLKKIAKNNITADLLENVVEMPMSEDTKRQGIQEAILKIISSLNKGLKKLPDEYEISENIPLYELYQLILDENPHISVTIEQLESVINSLADQGYIPGIMKIENGEDYHLKLVQLKAYDITKEESTLIKLALKLQKFSVADVVSETGWSVNKINQILEFLSESGILKHSRSYLHGDQWYIISE